MYLHVTSTVTDHTCQASDQDRHDIMTSFSFSGSDTTLLRSRLLGEPGSGQRLRVCCLPRGHESEMSEGFLFPYPQCWQKTPFQWAPSFPSGRKRSPTLMPLGMHPYKMGITQDIPCKMRLKYYAFEKSQSTFQIIQRLPRKNRLSFGKWEPSPGPVALGSLTLEQEHAQGSDRDSTPRALKPRGLPPTVSPRPQTEGGESAPLALDERPQTEMSPMH